MDKTEQIKEIQDNIKRNSGEWDLTDDNGQPMIEDKEKGLFITDLVINKDSEPCAVVPLKHFSPDILGEILSTM